MGCFGFTIRLGKKKVKEFKAYIGAGIKLKNRDFLVKQYGKGNIYIKNILEETAVSNEIWKLPHGLLELARALKLLDMKKFKQNMNREMKRQYPDRSKIETQVGITFSCKPKCVSTHLGQRIVSPKNLPLGFLILSWPPNISVNWYYFYTQ